jgi:tetratricopeptide (TPR) repeat protein
VKLRGKLVRLRLFQKNAAEKLARGQFAIAETYLRCALRLLNNTPVPTSDHLNVWNELGMVCKYRGKYRQAEKYYRLSLRHATACFTDEAELANALASIYHNLGGLQHSRRRFCLGEHYARKSLRLRQKSGVSDGAAIASDMVALAAILDGLRKFRESEKLYHRAFRIYRRVYGQRHAEIAVLLNNLAALYQLTNRPRLAEKKYLAALDMKRQVLAPTHPDVGVTMNNLAMLYQSQGNRDKALHWFQKALALLTVSLGPGHPSTKSVRTNLRREALNTTSAYRNAKIR